MTLAEAQSNLGKRCLISRLGSLQEATISELAPSNKCIKISFPNGGAGWHPIDEYDLVEVLDGTMSATYVTPLHDNFADSLFKPGIYTTESSNFITGSIGRCDECGQVHKIGVCYIKSNCIKNE